MSQFGRFIKERRANLEIGLREFCSAIHFDSSNWSKVERGLYPAPTDKPMLTRIADALQIQEPADRTQLRDLAFASRGQLPDDLTEDQYVMDMLPAFMRTVRDVRPTPDEMERLIEHFRTSYKKDVKPA